MGNYKDTIGFKQNNYGNIRGGGINYQGKIGMKNGFSVFESPIYGIRAIYKDLLAKISSTSTDTIAEIITKYAPPIENDTVKYINTVSRVSGIHPNAVLGKDLSNLRKIVKAIILHEIGYKIPDSELIEAEKIIFQKKKSIIRKIA